MLGHLVSAEWTLLTVDGGPRGGGVTSKARLEMEARWMESEFVADMIVEKFNYNLQHYNLSIFASQSEAYLFSATPGVAVHTFSTKPPKTSKINYL